MSKVKPDRFVLLSISENRDLCIFRMTENNIVKTFTYNPTGSANSVQQSPRTRTCCDVITPASQQAEPPSCDGDNVSIATRRIQFRNFSENFFKLRQRVSRKVKKEKKKEKNAARKERKATKTLAIVLGKFYLSLETSVIRCRDYFQHLAIYINENLPNGVQKLLRLVQNDPQ